ncbi:MAG: hypothetical protein HOI95_24075 [Chromatiales bacterium]|jgi:hypothetical protein|nr:hypothetical protein [Chromatiales bacterium]
MVAAHGNEHFASFSSTESKSRINFLELLRAPHTDYRLNDTAWDYLQGAKFPHSPAQSLRNAPAHFDDSSAWSTHLDALKS